MPSADELVGVRSELAGDLAAGVEAISSNQTIKFTKYVRLVLPLDGYIFWVKADLVAPGAVPNAAPANVVAPDQPPSTTKPAATFEAQGSFHFATENRQQADSSYSVNRVVFTSLEAINAFNDVGPNVKWIGTFGNIRFAFSSRKNFYQQAKLWHYLGDAVYPIMESQLIDSPAQFSGRQIVSNSLPLWLAINTRPIYEWEYFGAGLPTLYPAYLAEENADPPFAAVDVTNTTPIASAPVLGRRLEHSQQVRDRVKITLWGLDNDAAMNFVDFINEYSLNDDLFGIANVPVSREERVVQVELGVIAKKKVIEYEVNYHQRSARDVARQLILRAVPSFIFN